MQVYWIDTPKSWQAPKHIQNNDYDVKVVNIHTQVCMDTQYQNEHHRKQNHKVPEGVQKDTSTHLSPDFDRIV